MFIVVKPAYRGQLVDLAYQDAEGKEKRFMRVLSTAPLEVVDDPKRTDGIPSVVADALVRRGKATLQEPEAFLQGAEAPITPTPNLTRSRKKKE